MKLPAFPGDAPAGPDTIPVLRYSTDHLPPADRYQAWLRRDWPRRTQIYRTEPSEPFNTSWESAQLGEVTFVYTKITGMRWERRRSDIRSSDFDPIIINMMIEGLAQGDMDGRAFYEPGGTLHFHDLGRPSLHVSSASITYSIVIPRPLALQLFGTLHDLHGLVVPAAVAEMLFAHAEQTRRALPRLEILAAQGLGRVFQELAVIALAEVRPRSLPVVTSEKLLLQRVEAEIDRRLGDGKITIAELCGVLGVSRARMFAAFRAEGGIHHYVARQRLERARAALADLTRAEPIGNIAHRLGFSDAPHFSRAFRTRFGMSPRDYRALVAASPAEDTPG
ncbi:helix-turn-helix transcriptional regulator [Sphingomonas sp. 28-63-12]|uniref:helix-turn-helix transcriptional regulator n=1 Tax=Sphingomonas sp. 28-63-12 TaxID=1970434 RepID=UPI0035A8919A